MATKIDVTAVSVAQFCALLQIAQSTVYEWFASGCPRREDGRVDLREALPWLNRRRVSSARAEGARSDSPALERLREAKARSAELDLGLRAGQLYRKQDVELEWGRVLGELRMALMGLPSAVAPRLANKTPKEVAAGLEQAIRVAVDRARARIAAPDTEAKGAPAAKSKSKTKKGAKR